MLTSAVEVFIDGYIVDNISVEDKTKEELRLWLKQKKIAWISLLLNLTD